MAYSLRWGCESRASCIRFGWSRGMDWQLPECDYHCIPMTCRLSILTLNVCMLEGYDDVLVWYEHTFHRRCHLCGHSIGYWWFPLTKNQKYGALIFSVLLDWISCWTNNRIANYLRTQDALMCRHNNVHKYLQLSILCKNLAVKSHCVSKTIRKLRARYSESLRPCLPW